MCLGIPMKIKSIKGGLAEVQTGGLKRTVNIEMVPEAKVGDYVIIHTGFAIEKLDEKRAKETLRLINEVPLEAFSKRQKGRL